MLTSFLHIVIHCAHLFLTFGATSFRRFRILLTVWKIAIFAVIAAQLGIDLLLLLSDDLLLLGLAFALFLFLSNHLKLHATCRGRILRRSSFLGGAQGTVTSRHLLEARRYRQAIVELVTVLMHAILLLVLL